MGTGRRRGTRRWAAVLLIALAAAGCGSSAGHGGPPPGTPDRTAPGTPADAAGDPMVPPTCVHDVPGSYRHLRNGAPDGVTHVFILGTGTRGVVVGAQANGDICQTLPYGRTLAARGYRVALFDWTSTSSDYARDLRTATAAVQRAGAHTIVVGGFSRGALVALGAAPGLGPHVRGVFSVSGGPSVMEGYGTIASLARFRGPILLIASADDGVFPPGTSAQIAGAHRRFGPDTLLVVPGSAHALALLAGPSARRVTAAIDGFLARTLGARPGR